MKKKSLFALICAGVFGFAVSSCSSDSVDDTPANYLEKVGEVSYANGVMHYDNAINQWYVCTLKVYGKEDVRYNFCSNLDPVFQKENLCVIFSGEVHQWVRGYDAPSAIKGQYMIYLSNIEVMSAIDENNLQPLTGVDEELEAFMKNAIPTKDGSFDDYFVLFPNSREDRFTDVCYVINDMDDLRKICKDGVEMPLIDFDNYTLIIGRMAMSNGGASIVRHDISSLTNAVTLNVYVKQYTGLVSHIIINDYYWGLYPKIERDSLLINKVITKVNSL